MLAESTPTRAWRPGPWFPSPSLLGVSGRGARPPGDLVPSFPTFEWAAQGELSLSDPLLVVAPKAVSTGPWLVSLCSLSFLLLLRCCGPFLLAACPCLAASPSGAGWTLPLLPWTPAPVGVVQRLPPFRWLVAFLAHMAGAFPAGPYPYLPPALSPLGRPGLAPLVRGWRSWTPRRPPSLRLGCSSPTSPGCNSPPGRPEVVNTAPGPGPPFWSAAGSTGPSVPISGTGGRGLLVSCPLRWPRLPFSRKACICGHKARRSSSPDSNFCRAPTSGRRPTPLYVDPSR